MPCAFRLSTFDFRLLRSSVFPLHELYISAALTILIAAALYFFAGAWGVVLLWGLAVLSLLPLAVAPLGLLAIGKDRMNEGRALNGAAFMLGGLLLGAAWLAAAGYFAYRGYLSIP